MRALACVALAVLGGSAGPAVAQPATGTASPPRTHRLSIAAGAVWAGGYPVGDRAAEIRRNAPGSTPPSFTVFRAESTFQSTAGFEARIGFALTSSLTIEGGAQWSKPHLLVEITQDTEGASASFDGQVISQYVIDASVIWRVPGFRQSARVRPFAMGGVGYLRQLYDERTLVETGEIYHVGGGVQYLFRGAEGRRRPLGVRADVRANIRRHGIEFAEEARTYPTVSGMVFFGF
jgi:hypothetical protein